MDVLFIYKAKRIVKSYASNQIIWNFAVNLFLFALFYILGVFLWFFQTLLNKKQFPLFNKNV